MDRNQQRRLKGGLSQGLGGRGAGGLLSSEATVVAGKTAVNQPQGGGAAGGGGGNAGLQSKRFCFSNLFTDPPAGQSRPTHPHIIPAALRHDTGTKSTLGRIKADSSNQDAVIR